MSSMLSDRQSHYKRSARRSKRIAGVWSTLPGESSINVSRALCSNFNSSSSPSTQLQAAESIHRLSIWSDELRAILEASGARPALSRLIWLNKVFRFKNREVGCALLSSCEKALASVEDTAFHSVLKEWKCVTGCGWLPEDVARPIWVKISTYLS